MSYKSKNFLTTKSFTGTSASRKEEVHHASVIDYDQEMTLAGTMNKTVLLFMLSYRLCYGDMVDGF
jgi:hypothetical protein